MLIAQNIPRVRRDAFDHISCLTAVTLDGKLLWQKGRPDPKASPRVYACGSDEGFPMWDILGNLIKHTHIGHALSPSVAKYRMDVPGLQLMATNYCRGDGHCSRCCRRTWRTGND